MLKDSYKKENIYENLQLEPSMDVDPELKVIDNLLDDDGIYNSVKSDLEKRYPNTKTTGRPSTPVEVILRMIILMHLYAWSFAQTVKFVMDSISLRQFCRVYLHNVPTKSTLIRWHNCIKPETIQMLHRRVVSLAIENRVTKGRKLRIDTTVVETNIHHPTDGRLLFDSVKTISRIVGKVKAMSEEVTSHFSTSTLRNRTRSAKKRVLQIVRNYKAKGKEKKEQLKVSYGKLIEITSSSVRQAEAFLSTTSAILDTLPNDIKQTILRLKADIQHYLPLIKKCILQAEERVIKGNVVDNAQKILSIFQEHTQVIARGKARAMVEFGKKVLIAEVEGGIITIYKILKGNPADSELFTETLDKHIHQIGKAPHTLAVDKGFYSSDNEKHAEKKKVKRIVMPKKGKKSKARTKIEKKRWFKRGYRFRAGIEGRISVLKRRHGLSRCRANGEDGFQRWVGFGIIASNLEKIARAKIAA